MEKIRYLVLTDIFDGFEVDDIQSMIRLLLYSNEMDLEGLIASTSCFVKNDTLRREQIIHDLIDRYAQVLPSLRLHAQGWPSADHLHSITCSGIDEFGICPGVGFGHMRYADNTGVRHIIETVDKDDPRPVYVGLWGGANTLAQAVWQVSRTRSPQALNVFLAKLRIYSISDQDHASRWLRKHYGNRLFWIVSPTSGSWFGNWGYWRATWPGISSDFAKHGSEDGVHRSHGFSGGDAALVSNEWLQTHILSKGPLGSKYPLPKYIVEGDTPCFLWLLSNGLNDPEHPEYGGWGGRYQFYKPNWRQFYTIEHHPIWTNSCDSVTGSDGKVHTSPQATIWRWRSAFQNDFIMRLDWSVSPRFEDAVHPPVVYPGQLHRQAAPGEEVILSLEAEDPNGNGCSYRWFVYPEAGTCEHLPVLRSEGNTATLVLPDEEAGKMLHVICAVSTASTPSITRYARYVITFTKKDFHN